MPSIKASLSDREYELITSIAGDNFNEEQQLPAGAIWLERSLLKDGERDDDYIEDDNDDNGGIRYSLCLLSYASPLNPFFHKQYADGETASRKRHAALVPAS